jgi:hypothetical protein
MNRLQEEIFYAVCKKEGLPKPLGEWQFALDSLKRKWAFDFCWLHESGGGVALEVEGGIWREKGAHNTGTAITRDIEKYNNAQLLGFIVLRCVPTEVSYKKTLEMIKKALIIKGIIK